MAGDHIDPARLNAIIQKRYGFRIDFPRDEQGKIKMGNFAMLTDREKLIISGVAGKSRTVTLEDVASDIEIVAATAVPLLGINPQDVKEAPLTGIAAATHFLSLTAMDATARATELRNMLATPEVIAQLRESKRREAIVSAYGPTRSTSTIDLQG